MNTNKTKINNIDRQYQALLQYILDNGVRKTDRTGTGTLSVFGRQIRHNMKEGFPLLTTKKVAWKQVVTELLWFLRGDTNIKYLIDNDCHIWDGDAYKNYVTFFNSLKYTNPTPLTKEEFINKIKTDPEFAKEWGELGPIYGKQWRNWEYETVEIEDGRVKEIKNHEYKAIDQIANSINLLKTDPDSRRNKVSAWNVGELNQMVLPPCHTDFQFYTRELTREEQYGLYPELLKVYEDKNYFIKNQEYQKATEYRNKEKQLLESLPQLPTRAISLMWNQRSVDTFLGLPFNIASYALLLEIVAKEVNMVPNELIGNLGDTHLYLNHIEQAKEQITRTSYELPRVRIETDALTNIFSQELTGRDKFNVVKPEQFIIENYQSHPAIKAPLSN